MLGSDGGEGTARVNGGQELGFPEIAGSRDEIRRITEAADGMLRVLVAGSPYSSKEELEVFLQNVRSQKSPDENALLNQVCNDILFLYDQSSIEGAEEALGNLRGIVLDKYPNIPYPNWM